MSIRGRVIFVIVLTNLFIIMFSVFSGIAYAGKNMEKTIEADMMVVANIADHFISAELELLRMQASEIVHHLTVRGQLSWSESLEKLETRYPQFLGMAVFSTNSLLDLIASAGKSPAPPGLSENEYIRRAFEGKKVFTSTISSDDGVVIYLAVPIPEFQGHILVVTIPGMYFSERVSNFVIWKTGHIFIDDAEGTVIANIRSEWVQQRVNFIRMGEADSHYAEMGNVIKKGVEGGTGIGRFSVAGIPRICAYRPISGSEEGWLLGIIAPLPESPVSDLNRGLLFVGFIGFLLSVLAAIIASYFIKKPFEKVAALKEEAEAHLRSKSDFLANMSHEIRTPLNVVISLTDLILEDDHLDKHTAENLTKVSNAGGTLLSIVNDILDFSKIESGKLTLSPVEYYTSSLLNDINTLVITRLGEKPITFHLNISDDLPARLYGDDLRIKQVFTNLLNNAIKYTRQGSIELSIRCTREDDTVWMDVIVSDTGIGIREDDVKKLFLDYFQVDAKANRNIEGTGLGLPITKRLVEMMDGEINAESEYGKGTTFRLRIRQGFAGDAPIGQELADKLRSFRYADDRRIVTKRLVRLNLDYAKVLVVDDIQTNLDVAAGLLRKYKMRVDCLRSGQDAIDRIRGGNPVYNAIFMDHMMPGMDGIEAADAIRALGTEYARKIPIIALTANAIHGTEEMFFKHDFQSFISKPIDIMELDSVIRKWVRNEALENSLISGESSAADIPPEDKNDEDIVIDIPGVNAESGIFLYGGDKEIYLSILRSFALNTPGILDELRIVSRETLPNYIISVHGLKGSCAGIGAEAVRKAASDLETISRAGNLDEVLAQNDKLIEDAQTVIADVKAWLENYDAHHEKPRLKTPDREVLARLRRSCEQYDMSGIDKAMSELESANYEENGDLVVWLREKINISEINEAAARLAQYEKKEGHHA
jgi:signal transduction histidine kinase/CheY-like chemotaxis protein/HPt (histidine-containing phosphotransfer) domain-containing protein